MADDQFFPELVGVTSDPESGTIGYVGGSEQEYATRTRLWLESAYEEATYEQSQNEEVKKIDKYIEYIMGKQWPSRRPSYRSSPINNRIWRLLWELVAIMTDIRPIFQIKATKESYAKPAEMLNKVTRSWWLTSDSDMALGNIILYAILTTGYGKLTWNNELRNGQGDLELQPLGPLDVLPLKPRHTLQSAQAVIYKSVMPLGWFKQKFGAKGALVQSDPGFSRYATSPGRPTHIPSMIFDALSPQMQRKIGSPERIQDSAYPTALYREFWIKDWTFNESNAPVTMGRPKSNWCYTVPPGKRLYPRGRLIAMGGRHILYDGPNPYWHGLFPFDVLRMNVVPWQFMGLCYSSDTEVLTKRGWIMFWEAREDDEFATRQIGTGKFEWQKAVRFTNRPYTGRMYNFKSRSVDLLVTPEHKMLVNCLPRKLGGNKKRSGETSITAAELAAFGNHHTAIPQTSTWDAPDIGEKVFRTGHYYNKPVTMSGDDYCAFMGAYLSEGWCDKNCVNICQFEKSKGYEPYRELLARILSKEPPRNKHDFYIPRRGLVKFCKQFGLSHEKYIPDDIMNASTRQIGIFFKFFMLGDGSLRKRTAGKIRSGEEFRQRLSTVSKRLANQLQEVVQKIGWSASIVKRTPETGKWKNGRVGKARPSYDLIVRYSKDMAVKSSIIDYDGTIHCVTVPNGFLYVRRNGRPSWCGNSDLGPLIPLQDIINNILAGVLDMVKKAVNPGFFGPKNAFTESTWDTIDWSMPGMRIGFNPMTTMKPEFAPAVQLPSFVMQLGMMISKEMDQSSGIAAITEMLKKKQVPSGETLDKVKDAQQTPLRLKGRNIEVFLRNLGTQNISNIFQFYDAERRFTMLGSAGVTDQDFDWDPGSAVPAGMKPEDFARSFTFTIEPGSLLNANRIDEAMMFARLRMMGDLDRATFFKKLDLGLDVGQVEAGLKREAQQGIPMHPPKGKQAAGAGMPK